jgi:branched-chain amino acid transport system ATP-binding protein/neutral amino acid transport system ATP-binding protein
MGVLSAAGVVAGYSSADMVLRGLDIEVGAGEIVAIIGPNGAGKSTFLKAVAGLVQPSQGTIAVLGHSVVGLRPREITRRGVAFVPQEANVFGMLTVRENLEMGGYVDPAGTRTRVPRLLERFPMLAEKRHQAARTLSGGQRQVLAMAMALMVEPELLLLDEPSAGLSPIAAGDLFATIREINGEGVSIAMVEQNALEALQIAHRAYILVDGRTHRSGTARELARDPEVKRIFLGL